MNIRNKNIFIEISVHFEEPLQDVELVEEETVELPPLYVENSGYEIESVISDISGMMSDISEY